MDLRRKVLAAHDRGVSQRRLAAQFGLALSTVHGWIKRQRETGSVAPLAAPGAAPKLDPDGRATLRRIVEAAPDGTLAEWAEALRAETGVRLDPSTVRQYLLRSTDAGGLGLTRKKRPAAPRSATATT